MFLMEKTILNHHASTILAKCDSSGEFLLGQYDPGYPGKNKHWIGRVKLLGGNYFYGKNEDNSPLATVQREIHEEFSVRKADEEEMASVQEHKFASKKEIEYVRNALLDAEPFADYFLHQPGPEDKPQTYVIQSVFRASIPPWVMECARDNLGCGKSLTNEGVLAIKTLDQLAAGDPLCQGITGLVIGQSEGVVLPYCFTDKFTFAPMGMPPRDSYKAYSDCFQYRDHSKK